ncbi:MAG: DMT family transporter [Patescibacteria group bacterium]|nr:DMT family transporter [Patescibacteria group bacterium]
MNRGYKLILATALISGLSVYFNKFGVSVSNPYIFTGLKNALVVLFIVLAIAGTKKFAEVKKLRRQQWLSLLLLGLVGGGVPFLLFFKGLSLTSAAQGAFIHKTMFVWVAILALVFLKEKINRWTYFGLASLVVGLVLMFKIAPQGLHLGDGLILLATLLWAGEQIIAKKVLRSVSPLLASWGRMFFGLIIIFGFWTMTNQLPALAHLTWPQIQWTIVTSLFLFGYVVTWYSGLRYIPAAVAASILALGFPITVFCQLVIDRQIPSWSQTAGNFVVLASLALIFLVNRQKQIKSAKV